MVPMVRGLLATALCVLLPVAALAAEPEVSETFFCAAVMPDCDENGQVVGSLADPKSPCYPHYANLCLRARLDEVLNEGAVCKSDVAALRRSNRELSRRQKRAQRANQ